MSAWSDNGIVIHGDGGNDTLNGGAGNDALTAEQEPIICTEMTEMISLTAERTMII